MKKYTLAAVILLSLALACPALASGYEGALPEDMFVSALTALDFMSGGDYQTALDILGLDDVKAKEFRFFAESGLPSIYGGVQDDFALGIHTEDYGWLIAVPLWNPNSLDVETFLLHSSDGETFDGYSAAAWSFVEELLQDDPETIVYRTEEGGGKYIIPDA